jgi:hypothetical protein
MAELCNHFPTSLWRRTYLIKHSDDFAFLRERAKQFLAVFFACYCSVFGGPRINEVPEFGKQSFIFVFTRINESALP